MSDGERKNAANQHGSGDQDQQNVDYKENPLVGLPFRLFRVCTSNLFFITVIFLFHSLRLNHRLMQFIACFVVLVILLEPIV
jgi:hypothetical protein